MIGSVIAPMNPRVDAVVIYPLSAADILIDDFSTQLGGWERRVTDAASIDYTWTGGKMKATVGSSGGAQEQRLLNTDGEAGAFDKRCTLSWDSLTGTNGHTGIFGMSNGVYTGGGFGDLKYFHCDRNSDNNGTDTIKAHKWDGSTYTQLATATISTQAEWLVRLKSNADRTVCVVQYKFTAGAAWTDLYSGDLSALLGGLTLYPDMNVSSGATVTWNSYWDDLYDIAT